MRRSFMKRVESRTWVECVRASAHKTGGIKYIMVADQSRLVGDARSRRVVSQRVSERVVGS
jgi:hypothetical protein